MGFGLIVVGDEILSGKREDKHFPRVRDLLARRGLGLDWVRYLGDDRERLTHSLRETFAGGDVVFSCGGIGGTPDDHTRQAAAAALDLPLALHPEARDLIAARMVEVGQPLTRDRLSMAEFPTGAEIIPNPFNRIPGFHLREHFFVPGFPVMAWPMIEWVLDTRYARLFHQTPLLERSLRVEGLAEGTLTPLMQEVETACPGIRVFSLPHMEPERRQAYHIELGVKGPDPTVLEAAFRRLETGVAALQAQTPAAEGPRMMQS